MVDRCAAAATRALSWRPRCSPRSTTRPPARRRFHARCAGCTERPCRRAALDAALPRARDGSLGAMFDHGGIAVSDLAASERFYRTVLSVLGVEPSHADAELVEWEDWAIGPADREHPYPRPDVAFRAPDRAAVDAFWQAGIDAGHPDDGAPGPRTSTAPTITAASCSTRTATASRRSTPTASAPCPTAASTTCGSAFATRRRRGASTRRSRRTPGSASARRAGRVQLSGRDFSFSLVRGGRPLTEHVHLAFPAEGTPRSGLPRRRARRGLRGPRRARRATRVPPGLLRRLRARPGRPQRRGRQPQPLSHGRARRVPGASDWRCPLVVAHAGRRAQPGVRVRTRGRARDRPCVRGRIAPGPARRRADPAHLAASGRPRRSADPPDR